MSVRTSLALLLVLLLVSPTLAGDTRTIELPRAGLSLEVPTDWTLEQYGDALLELKSGEVTVTVRPSDAKSPTSRKWGRIEHGQDEFAQLFAFLPRDGVSVFKVEARLPKEWPTDEVDALLASMDTTPYEHATRHVDWNDGWTLTLPEGWERKPEARKGVVRFEAAERSSRLWVEDLPGLMKFTGGAPEAERDLDGWADFAWKEGLKRLQQVEGVTSEEAPVVETLKRGDREGRRLHLGLDPDADGKPQAWMHVLVFGGYRVLATTRGTDAEADAVVREAVDSFLLGTHPGPRAATALPTDRFPGDKGPDVVFALPSGWTVAPGSNSMRLAQVVLPDVTGVDAVVFFFGAGAGGEVDDNLERWRGQMKGDDEGTVEVHEPVAGVKVHVLDVTGAYSTSPMNPHGNDPHANPHGGGAAGHGDFRLLGAVVEIAGGPLFVKVIGPKRVVGDLKAAMTAWLLSFRPAS